MKDKLVKYHHKAMYYKARKISVIAGLGLIFALLITIPVSIFSTAEKNRQNLADNSSSQNNDENSQTSEIVELIRYEQ